MENTRGQYARSIRWAPVWGGALIALALAAVAPGDMSRVLFSMVINFIVYFLVCLVIAWGYRGLKLPARWEFAVVLLLPLSIMACAAVKFVTDIAGAVAQ
jgi:hypothetical protein